jgi:protein-disulfide isomerase
MNTYRLIIGLVVLTIGLQSVILYKQYRKPDSIRQKTQPVRDAPKDSIIRLDGVPVKGDPGTRLVLVEFSDYECPYCGRHASGVGQQLDDDLVASGRIRHAFINNPLSIHPHAKLLATAAICAGEQNRYWEMHDALFQKKPTKREELTAISKELHFDLIKFDQCVDHDSKPAQDIQRDTELAKRFGLTGTPSFAIGFTETNGNIHVEKFIAGAQPLETFTKAIAEVAMKTSKS